MDGSIDGCQKEIMQLKKNSRQLCVIIEIVFLWTDMYFSIIFFSIKEKLQTIKKQMTGQTPTC